MNKPQRQTKCVCSFICIFHFILLRRHAVQTNDRGVIYFQEPQYTTNANTKTTQREKHICHYSYQKKMVPLSRVAKDYRLCAVWASIKTPEMHGFLEAFGYSLKSSCDRQTEAEVHVGCGSVALEAISAPTTNNLYWQSQIQHIYCIRFSRKYRMPRANEPQCSGNSHEKLLRLHEPILHSQLAVWLPTLPSTIL